MNWKATRRGGGHNRGWQPRGLGNQQLLQTTTQTSWRECPEESRVPGQQCSDASLATIGGQSRRVVDCRG